jgi:mono/diheme cytochrome c family protein
VIGRTRDREYLAWGCIILARSTLMAVALLAPIAAYTEDAVPPDWADVSVIFEERCVMCHSAVAGASKGLRLDDYAAVLAGSERGAVLVAGNAAGSELVRRLRGESTPRMPFLSRSLTDDQIALIESWIAASMPYESEVRQPETADQR